MWNLRSNLVPSWDLLQTGLQAALMFQSATHNVGSLFFANQSTLPWSRLKLLCFIMFSPMVDRAAFFTYPRFF